MTCPFVCSSRPHLGSVPDFRFPMADGPAEPYSSGAVLRRPQKGRLAALRDEPSKARPRPSASPKLCVDFLFFFPSVSLTPVLFRGHSIHLVKRIHVWEFRYFCIFVC